MSKKIKYCYALLIVSMIAAIIHNAIFAFFQIEEAGFFLLSITLFLLFLILTAYNIYTYIKIGKPRDLWMLGWIGLVGLFGLFSDANIRFFYAFFAFFAFFGLKRE